MAIPTNQNTRRQVNVREQFEGHPAFFQYINVCKKSDQRTHGNDNNLMFRY